MLVTDATISVELGHWSGHARTNTYRLVTTLTHPRRYSALEATQLSFTIALNTARDGICRAATIPAQPVTDLIGPIGNAPC